MSAIKILARSIPHGSTAVVVTHGISITPAGCRSWADQRFDRPASAFRESYCWDDPRGFKNPIPSGAIANTGTAA